MRRSYSIIILQRRQPLNISAAQATFDARLMFNFDAYVLKNSKQWRQKRFQNYFENDQLEIAIINSRIPVF